MKISSEIGSAACRIGEEKAIQYIAEAGFDAWDFTMVHNMCRTDWNQKKIFPTEHPLSGPNYLAYARRLKQVGLDCGIECNQSHAPFPIYYEGIEPYVKRAIECTAEAGGKICIIHPDNNKNAEENAEFYHELLPFAKGCGVKIATENMWNWNPEKDEASFAACSTAEDFRKHLDVVQDDYFVACLDIGHAEMRGLNTNAVEMIRVLGDKLGALHIHDNDQWHDSHMVPFTGAIDFGSIVNALKECNYQGYLTLEADRHLSHCTDEDIFVGIKEMAESAKRLREMYEE